MAGKRRFPGEEEYVRLKAKDMNSEGCINLVAAFVNYIREDYETCMLFKKRFPNDENNNEQIEKIIGLLKSKRFGMLTNLDGTAVLREFNKSCKEKGLL